MPLGGPQLPDQPSHFLLSVNKVLDVEENVWSPKFGIKGKIDVSLQATSVPVGTKGQVFCVIYVYFMFSLSFSCSFRLMFALSSTITLSVPLVRKDKRCTLWRLKQETSNTFRTMHSSHFTRSSWLITMVKHLRPAQDFENLHMIPLFVFITPGVPIQSGLLYYMKKNEMMMIPTVHGEIRALIIQRNTLAKLLTENKLAPVLKDTKFCSKCDFVDACLIHHKACENGTKESSGMGELFPQRTGHLEPHHLEFFEFWDKLISMELGDVQNLRKQVWTSLPEEREKSGKCLSKMVVSSEHHEPQGHRYTFKKRQEDPRTQKSTSLNQTNFLETHIHLGDPVVVSSEDGLFFLAIGFVKEISSDSITLSADREFHPPLSLNQGQAAPTLLSDHDFHGIMELKPNAAPFLNLHQPQIVHPPRPVDQSITYRIDLDELSSGYGLARTNLLRLFTVDGDEKRRRLLVDLDAPTFQPPSYFTRIRDRLSDFGSLNVDQKRAVETVIRGLFSSSSSLLPTDQTTTNEPTLPLSK